MESAPAEPGRLLELANSARAAAGERRSALLHEALACSGDPAPPSSSAGELERRLDRRLGHPSRRLATYGTLRPGESNHAQVADLAGTWRAGWVRGRLHAEGWGLAHGFPALVPDPEGERVAVQVLESVRLSAHWARLDAFEGGGYTRVLVEVELDEAARVVAHLYALARDP